MNVKKIIVSVILIAISTKQYAQIEKGTYVPSITITGGYTNSPYKDTIYSSKTNNWNIGANLSFGKFIQENLLLTGSFGFVHSNSKTDIIGKSPPLVNKGSSGFGNNESVGGSVLKYKFLTENFAIRYGASLSISYIETINRDYYSVTSYVQATSSFNTFTNSSTSYSNSLGATLNLLMGIQYFVSKNLALTGTMGFFNTSYMYSPYQKVKQVDTHTLNFSLTPSFNAFTVGLSYYIRPKNETAK
jgi:hypothetical protein